MMPRHPAAEKSVSQFSERVNKSPDLFYHSDEYRPDSFPWQPEMLEHTFTCEVNSFFSPKNVITQRNV